MNECADEIELSIEDHLRGYREGTLEVRSVIECCLDRIGRLDRRGAGSQRHDHRRRAGPAASGCPRRRAQIDRRPATVARYSHGHQKNNINVAGLPTTGGCAALKDLRPAEDANIVAELNKAGAVILGKSSMSEFAWGTYDTENSIIDGFTRNPYNPDYASGRL